MKLKNKKTGEIRYCKVIYDDLEPQEGEWTATSLAELNADWEDVPEEPKGWCITMYGGITRINKDDENFITDLKEIGNYFNDKESAYDTLDKLKAWKRLKDKGFRFTGINDDEDSQELITQCGILCEADIYHLAKDEDFLLLFGGNE